MEGFGEPGKLSLGYCLKIFGGCLDHSKELFALPGGQKLAYDYIICWSTRFYYEGEIQSYWLDMKEYRIFSLKIVKSLKRFIEALQKHEDAFDCTAGVEILKCGQKEMNLSVGGLTSKRDTLERRSKIIQTSTEK